MAVNCRRGRIPLLILGVSIPAILHGLNDWSGTAFYLLWAPITIGAFSLLVFLGYTPSAATIGRRVHRSPTFRGQSILMETFSQHGKHG